MEIDDWNVSGNAKGGRMHGNAGDYDSLKHHISQQAIGKINNDFGSKQTELNDVEIANRTNRSNWIWEIRFEITDDWNLSDLQQRSHYYIDDDKVSVVIEVDEDDVMEQIRERSTDELKAAIRDDVPATFGSLSLHSFTTERDFWHVTYL